MNRFSLITLFFLVAATHARGLAKEDVQVRFLAESAPPELGQVVLVSDKERSAPFNLPINHLSTPQSPPARVFSLWSVASNVSLASVTLPEEGKAFIVLLVLSSKTGYSTVVIRSNEPSFGPGDIYFHNISNKTVLGYVGTSKFTIPPSSGIVVHPKGAREEKFYDVGLGVLEEEGGRVVAVTRWPEDHLSRFYVFFYLNPETKRISYRAVDEFVEKIEQPLGSPSVSPAPNPDSKKKSN